MKKPSIPTVALLTLLSVFVGLLTFSTPTNAVTATTDSTAGNGQALEISPPVLNLTADPGQTIKAQLSLRDITNNKLIVSNQIDDFVANGEDGTPKLLIDSTETSPYSIKSWISPLNQLTLSPKQIKTIPVTIKVPSDAAPGGYYGVIRFSGKAPELKDTGVSLSASLGALIMLRVNGPVTEKMSLVEFGTSQYGKNGTLFEFTPITFFERIKNDGNIHEQPTGQIIITDMFGKTVAGVNINMPPKNVLPASTRKFEQQLDKASLGTRMLFGKYTASLKVKYGASKNVLTKTITFWIIPYKLIGAAVLIIISAITILIFMIKRYNQFIIKKAQGVTKTKKPKKIKKTKNIKK